jgi:hypothetical protein
MKNSELLSYTGNDRLLTQLDGQRRYVLRTEVGPFRCPNCGFAMSRWDALGIHDVDDYDMSTHHGDEGSCPKCHRSLLWRVYMTGGCGFELVPIEVAS